MCLIGPAYYLAEGFNIVGNPIRQSARRNLFNYVRDLYGVVSRRTVPLMNSLLACLEATHNRIKQNPNEETQSLAETQPAAN